MSMCRLTLKTLDIHACYDLVGKKRAWLNSIMKKNECKQIITENHVEAIFISWTLRYCCCRYNVKQNSHRLFSHYVHYRAHMLCVVRMTFEYGRRCSVNTYVNVYSSMCVWLRAWVHAYVRVNDFFLYTLYSFFLSFDIYWEYCMLLVTHEHNIGFWTNKRSTQTLACFPYTYMFNVHQSIIH